MAKDLSAKPKEKKQRGKAIKETFSELKKVTWPSFGEVVKQTGIVLAVVLAFLVVLIGFDTGLGALYKLLVTGLHSGTTSALSLTGTAGFTGVVLPIWLI